MGTYICQVLMAMAGSFGFALLFQTRGKKVMIASVCGGLIWAFCLFLYEKTANDTVAYFFATISAAIVAEVLARILKTPAITLLVTILIPLVPGGTLYYTMSSLLRGDTVVFAQCLDRLVPEAGAIAIGIIFTASVVQIITKCIYYMQNWKKWKR